MIIPSVFYLVRKIFGKTAISFVVINAWYLSFGDKEATLLIPFICYVTTEYTLEWTNKSEKGHLASLLFYSDLHHLSDVAFSVFINISVIPLFINNLL